MACHPSFGVPAPDQLCFYSGSADKPPGKGANEGVLDATDYADLAATPHWRRVLSNFHVAPFVLNGRTYRSIEHAFQASKIALVDPALAQQFSVESGSALGLGDGAAAQRARKLAVLPPAQLRVWDALKAGVMDAAARAKYAASPEAAAVLKATRGAQLWHRTPRSQPVRFLHLESIRAALC